MTTTGKEPQERRPYAAPELKVINLQAEEVLAAGCKTITGGPPPRNRGCQLGGCFKKGS